MQVSGLNDLRFLAGGGEMGSLMRAKDWSQTPVGEVEYWPQSLKTAINIILNSKFPMFIWWGDQLTCFYNDAYRPSLGNNGKHPGILGEPARTAWAEIWEFIEPLINKVLYSGESVWMEDQLVPIYRNGKLEDVYWTFSYSPINDESLKPAGVLVTCVETTEKVNSLNNLKEKQQQLNQSEKKFRNSVKQAPVGITVFRGPDFHVELANDTYLQIVDRTEDEFIGKPLFEGLPEVKDAVEPLLRNVFEKGTPYYGNDFPVTINRYGKKELTYFNFVYQPLIEKNGDISGIIVVATEVTELTNAKSALTASEKRFRHMVMQSPIPMTIFRGRDFIIEIANKKMYDEIWRKKEEDVIGKKALEVFPELNNQKYPALLNHVFNTGEAHRENEALAFVEGDNGMQRFYLDFEYDPLFETDGTVSGIMITVNDVTEKVEARKKLEEHKERLNIIIEASKLGTWELDLVTDELVCSERYFEIFGSDRNTQLSHSEAIARIHPDDIAKRNEGYNQGLATGSLFYEIRLIWPDNSVHWIVARGKAFYDAKGNPIKMLGTIQDVTDIKEQEQQKDYFISMASHELKTPLTTISGYVQILKNVYGNSEDALLTNSLKTVDKQVRTLTNLISDLLDLSKIKSGSLHLNTERFQIKDLINETIKNLNQISATHKITFTKECEAYVKADKERISQVLINFITNAIKYSPGEKEVTVECTVEDDHVIVAVEDFGIGINKADQEKIFERFYRVEGKTETTFPGFGIGLYIASEIINRHNGKVGVHSEFGQGSIFYFTLAVVD